MLLTRTLKEAANLVNGSIGFGKEIIYSENETPASNLPMYVIVKFDGRTLVSLFPNDLDEYVWYQSNLLKLPGVCII